MSHSSSVVVAAARAPAVAAAGGAHATYRFLEFFTAQIRNVISRAAAFLASNRWVRRHGEAWRKRRA